MTAPALVALAHGSKDPRSAETVNALCAQVRSLRPDLRVEAAFLDHCEPSPTQLFDRLVAEGYDEVVVVPLLLTAAYHARVDVPAVVQEAADRHPKLRMQVTEVLGDDVLLDVLDRRLRTALKAERAREIDALVLTAAGSSDARANASVARLARLWGARHRLPAVAAFASAAPPASGEAVRRFRSEGRRHVAVGSYFIAPGFLPDRAEELAGEAGAIAVAEPLGADPEVAWLVLTRYTVAAVELVPLPA
ncbi:MAG TPA: sirohydrochlorin chelatase [Nocardioidaceae bacterium]|jgi:sirohydrochlorin ferrochelatase|nr:sirohydrochlorin chelatase [Nocardioidaceae bacterium]